MTQRLALDSAKLLELYIRFQKEQASLGELFPGVASHHGLFDEGRYHASAMVVTLLAADHTLQISNAINRFCYDLHRVIAWEKILASATEDEKILALFEFVSPVVSECLSTPYALKQMFIQTVCEISHQTNAFWVAGWSESQMKIDSKNNFKDAERFSGNYKHWPVLCSALSSLNNADYIE